MNGKHHVAISFNLLSLLFTLLFASSLASGQEQVNDWENPAVFARNKEAPHCTIISYDSIAAAQSGIRESSPYYKSLNGLWKFNWVKMPDTHTN